MKNVRRIALMLAQYLVDLQKDQESPKRDFPGGTVVKNPPANAGDTGSSPSLGRPHMPQSY